ncbi:MAG TPA: carbohydrate ABC transporter permease [Spirochaetia bacterium]|nr:carbohydrate ABC transporter permease [Spirochaetia bacterium]
MRRRLSVGYAAMVAGLLILGLMMVVPYLWMVLSSLKSNAEILSAHSTILPRHPTLAGFNMVLTQAPFFRWLWNSLITSTIITAVTLFTSAISGYIFAKFEFRAKKVLFFTLLASMMVPFAVVMIPTYLIVARMGIVDHLSSIVVPSLISAFGIFLCRQFIESLPRDLLEAARIDGAGEFRIFAAIVVPQIRPVMSALGIFTFMAAWNNYLWPLIVLNDIDRMTVPLALVFFNGRHLQNWNVVMSAGVLIMVPVLVVFFIFQKQFVKGLTLTGLK